MKFFSNMFKNFRLKIKCFFEVNLFLAIFFPIKSSLHCKCFIIVIKFLGRLAQWTKGFKCSGVESEDVVQLLKEAIGRQPGLNIDVCAILNDTTG